MSFSKMEKWLNKNKHWFALTMAVTYGGRKACLDVLHSCKDKDDLPKDQKLLYKAFLRHKSFLYTLLKHGVISLSEYDLIFNKQEAVDSNAFPLGLIIALLQSIVLRAPAAGWMDIDPLDTSVSAIIVHLRQFKDKLNDYKTDEAIDSQEFGTLWDELTEILHGLNFDVKSISSIFRAVQANGFNANMFSSKDEIESLSVIKNVYILKKISEVKTLLSKHVENVNTIMSVLASKKLSHAQSNILRYRKDLDTIYNIYDKQRYLSFRDVSGLLTACDRVTLNVELSDESLDRIINKYNSSLDDESQQINIHSNKPKVVKYFTLKKTAVMGWLQRNTIRNIPNEYRAGAAQEEREADVAGETHVVSNIGAF